MVMAKCDGFLQRSRSPLFYKATIVLRELLLNAIVHGNGEDPLKLVACSIEIRESEGLIIRVEDQGNGFDRDEVDMSLPDRAKHIRRRGYPLIRALAARLSFNRKGNRVTVLLSNRVPDIVSYHPHKASGFFNAGRIGFDGRVGETVSTPA